MKRAAAVLALFALILFLSACRRIADIPDEGNESDAVETETGHGEIHARSLDGYTVVCGEGAHELEKNAAKELYLALSAQAGDIGFSDDFDGKADHTRRPEILVGDTNRTETQSVMESCREYESCICWCGDRLVIASKRPDFTASAVRAFIERHLKEGNTDVMESIVTDYRDEIPSRRFFEAPEGGIAKPASSRAAGVESLGEKTISKNDRFTGGGQIIAKLYTELLSRCPEGAEFAALSDRIAAEGLSDSLLRDMIREILSSDEFKDQKFTRRETAFAVCRAMLSRDPTEEELLAAENTPDPVEEVFANYEEWANLFDGFVRGPVFWRGTNETAYTGLTVLSAADVQAMLKPGEVTELEAGTLVLMDGTIHVPAGAVLRTAGDSTHYLRMARFLRTAGSGTGHHLIVLADGASLERVFIDGNMSAFGLEKTASGTNLVIQGSGCSVRCCRVSDSVSHQNVWSLAGTEGTYIGYSLVTAYASDHNKTWQDGISCLSAESLIEYNGVVDATDGGIVVFRYIEEWDGYDHLRPQDTMVRFNKILNAGNSCYASHDFETVNFSRYATGKPLYPANMKGLVSYENEIWTSWRAHTHLAVTLSTVPWQGDVCDRAYGMSFCNNRTPEGCVTVCACGICADKTDDAMIRGNDFVFWCGAWCRDDPRLGARAYSVNEKTCTGDYQPGYADMGMATESAVFIVNLPGGLLLEAEDEVVLKGTHLYEDPVSIPEERYEPE